MVRYFSNTLKVKRNRYTIMQIILPVRHRTSEQGRPLWRQVAPQCPGTLQNRRTSETYPRLTKCVVHTEWETSDKFWVERIKCFLNMIVINYLINYFKHVRESVYDEQIEHLIISWLNMDNGSHDVRMPCSYHLWSQSGWQQNTKRARNSSSETG